MDISDKWYNMNAVVEVDPLKDPRTGEIIKEAHLHPLFARELIKQEMSKEKYIKIPDEVREVYSIWRPMPLVRAKRLERALKTPAKIFYKWKEVSPPGSHKTNTAVARAYCNAEEIISYCKEKLAGYKVPRDVVFLDELPKINGWKLVRKELEGRYGNGLKCSNKIR